MSTPPASAPPAPTAWSVFLKLAPVAAIVFCGFAAVGVPLPALPKHVNGALGFGPIVVGWAVGLQSLVTVVTRGLGGTICDARGSKTAVLLGMPAAVLAGVAYLISALTTGAPVLSLGVLMAGRFLLGFAESLFLIGTMSWGIARVGAANTGRVMAWQGIAMYAAMGVGAPVGLALQEAYGFTAVAICVSAVPMIAILIAVLLPPAAHSRRPAAPRGSFLKALKLIWPQGLALAVSTAPFAAMAAFIALAFDARDWDGAGFALAAFAAAYVGARLVFGHLPDKVAGVRLAVISLLVELIGQLVLWSSVNEPMALVGAALTGGGYSLLFPYFGVQAMRKAPPEMRGLALGAFMAFFDVALGVTGPLAGAIAGRFGYSSVFLTGAVATVLGIVVVLAGARKPGAA